MLAFRLSLFKVCDDLTLTQSKLLAWGFFIACLVIEIIITHRDSRNPYIVVVNIAFPLGVYFLYLYWENLTRLTTITVSSALVCSSAYAFFILTEEIRNKANYLLIIKYRLKKCFFITSALVSCCFLIITFSLVVQALFTSSAPPTSKEKNDTWTINKQIDQVCLFSEPKWYTLSAEEKITAMQTIANIESNYLGLPHELTLIVTPLAEQTFASYNDAKHTISINSSHFEDHKPLDILGAICHEAYHAFQHRLCDVYNRVDEEYRELLPLYPANVYITEFSNYKNYRSETDSYLDYYYQLCEVDARKYQATAIEEYEFRINDHLGLSPQTQLANKN